MQHLHRCFRKCLTHQSNALSGSVAPYISICLKLDIVKRQWYLVWRPHFKLGEERLRAKFIHVFFPWDYYLKRTLRRSGLRSPSKRGRCWKAGLGCIFLRQSSCRMSDSVFEARKFLSVAETYAGNAPFWPQHWIPWFGVWVMSWSMNWPIWNK